MRIVFMGTPEFAVPVLLALLEAGHQVPAVVTQPDRAAGRGRRSQASPVKTWALARGLTVLQPPSFRQPEAVAELAATTPQALVVAAYGKLLPAAVLKVPPLGVLNVHPSLLPRHRGPSPVAAAILQGDEVTGVTVMLLDQGMDTGPILAQQTLGPIGPEETTGSLTPRLFHLGAQLLVLALGQWERGEVSPAPQDPDLATASSRITKEDGLLDFQQPAQQLWRQVRAYQPWPGAYTRWQGRLLKLLETALVPETAPASAVAPGRVVLLPPGAQTPYAVGTGQGLLGLQRLQLEGGRPMAADELQRGHPAFAEARLPS
jgi:methionyl-tRNA formyltransferase